MPKASNIDFNRTALPPMESVLAFQEENFFKSLSVIACHPIIQEMSKLPGDQDK